MRSQAELDAVIAALREGHRELQTRLTNRGIVRVLAREGIARRSAKLPVAAMIVLQYGRAAIVYDPDKLRNPREETAVLAEEFAHAKLHGGERDEVTIHLSSCLSEDPREYEAEYVARALLAGPGVEIEYFKPQKATAPAKPGRSRQPLFPVPIALPFLELPNPYDAAPGYITPQRSRPAASERLGTSLRKYARRIGPRVPLNSSPLRPRSPLVYGLDEARYRDAEGVWWAVHDVRVFLDLESGRVRQEEVGLGSERARRRYFVEVHGDRRRFYTFAKGELRTMAVRHIDRQMRDSTLMPARTVKVHDTRTG